MSVDHCVDQLFIIAQVLKTILGVRRASRQVGPEAVKCEGEGVVVVVVVVVVYAQVHSR